MIERMQKILSQRGIASRRKAEELIIAGRVTCNGAVCQLGQSADPDTDEILVDGRPLPSTQNHVYIMLHKPRGYVTTLSDEKGRKNAAQLVDCGCRVYPVGRLDMDSEGLLLFTNDGDFANRLMHPKHLVNKTYHVHVSKYSLQAVQRLREPIELDGYLIKRPEIEVLEPSDDGSAKLSVTIHEGRNRQVRRMCAAAGMHVERLVRISEGGVKLGNLKRGRWRMLTEDEVQLLMK